MPCYSSATLRTDTNCEVHLIGVSHTSAYSGKLAHDAILELKPDAVVLEVDEARLQEQALRAQRWLHAKERTQLVRHALQPFLTSGTLWEALTAPRCKRAGSRLSNEGSALLEGGIYGSEVILACEAAVTCGADIIAADRSKQVSDARLRAAAQREIDRLYGAHLDDDWSLLQCAAQEAIRRIAAAVRDVADALLRCDAEHFAEHLHPIFLLPSAPDYRPALLDAGCADPDAVEQALDRMMTHGSHPGGQVDPHDLALVQNCIAAMEHRKHRMRQHAFAQVPHSAPCGLDHHAHVNGEQRRGALEGTSCCADCSGGAKAQHESGCGAAREGSVSALGCRANGNEDCAESDSCLRSCAGGLSASATVQPVLPGLTAAVEHYETSGERLWGSFRAWLGTWSASGGGKRLTPHVHDPFYQWCWRGVGHMHSFRLQDHLGQPLADEAAPGDGVMSPYYRTTVYERDVVLTHRLRLAAEQPGRRRVVAVVGANHLPGIVRNWDSAGGEAMARQVREYVSVPAGTGGRAGEHEWKRHVVGIGASLLEGCVVAAAAYLPVRHAARRYALAGGGLRALSVMPLAAMAGAALGAALSDATRQGRVAHLVHNIAACADNADRQPGLQ